MTSKRIRLGDGYISQRKEKYQGDDIPRLGVSRDGFISPKQEEADFELYNVFYKNDFVYNPARMELNSIVFNNLYDKVMCSSLYEMFYIVKTDELLPEYLNMFLKRNEFARRCWYVAVGSARNYFRFNNLCDVELDIPAIEIQQKYVDIFRALNSNQKAYEKGLDDLKQSCDAFVEDLKRRYPSTKIGRYISQIDLRNKQGLSRERVCGITTKKEIIQTQADLDGVSLSNYKIAPPRSIAYVSDTSRRGNKISLAINDVGEDILVSSITTVFETAEQTLSPEYLMLYFGRTEFDRFARFNSWGSARETFSWDDMCEVSIPIPNTDDQKSISNVYYAYKKRKEINERLKKQMANICPILIKGSIEEAKRG